MDYDKILEKCGNFHRYQFMLLALFGFLNLFVSVHYFSQTIISFVPEHWCYHEKLENLSMIEISRIYSKFKNPSCTELYDVVDGIGIPSRNYYDDKDDLGNCTRWIYNYEFGYRSVTTELNWVCKNAFKSTIGQSLFFVGSVFGTLVYGILADKFGRLPILILANLSGIIGDFSTTFATTVPTFAICRFISGLAADMNYYLMYIMAIEYLRPSTRTLGIHICVAIFYCLGLVVAPWIAAGTGSWKHYLMIVSLPLILVLLFYFCLVESAQWLITQKKFSRAIENLKWIAKFNKREVAEEDFIKFENYCRENTTEAVKKSTFIGMFKTPRLRKLTLILFFKSMVITLCYDVVSRNIEGMGYSPFVIFSVTSAAILPAAFTMVCFQDKVGRKAMASGSLFFGGLFTTITGVILAYQNENSNAAILAAVSFIARYGVSISYESGAQYAAELIPTCVRGQGIAIVHVAGYFASCLSPYVIYLRHFFKPLPSLLLTLLLFVGSFGCLLLPETLNKKLPQSLEEGEVFGIGERMCDFPCINRKKKMDNERKNDNIIFISRYIKKVENEYF